MGPTANRAGLPEAGSFGTLTKKGKPKKRPYKSNRKPRGIEETKVGQAVVLKQGLKQGSSGKRKAVMVSEKEGIVMEKDSNVTKRKKTRDSPK